VPSVDNLNFVCPVEQRPWRGVAQMTKTTSYTRHRRPFPGIWGTQRESRSPSFARHRVHQWAVTDGTSFQARPRQVPRIRGVEDRASVDRQRKKRTSRWATREIAEGASLVGRLHRRHRLVTQRCFVLGPRYPAAPDARVLRRGQQFVSRTSHRSAPALVTARPPANSSVRRPLSGVQKLRVGGDLRPETPLVDGGHDLQTPPGLHSP